MKNRFAFIVQHKYRKILDKCKKYKPYILKYKALISKYMPCIFRVYKYLKKNVF